MKLITRYPKFESLQDRIMYKKRQHERLRQQKEMICTFDESLGANLLCLVLGVVVFYSFAFVLILTRGGM